MTYVLLHSPFDVLLRVVVVLLAATIAMSFMRRSSASLRALMLTATLVGTLVLPLVSWSAPSLQIAVLPAEGVNETPPSASSDAASFPETRSTKTKQLLTAFQDTRVKTGELEETAPLVEPSLSVEPAEIDRTAIDRVASIDMPSSSVVLVGAWMLGALLFLVRLALGHYRLNELISSSCPANDDWVATVDAIRAELDIRRRIDVRISHDIDIPAVAGVFTPVLLVPA
jgi:beta-lactamase regulating signal transducer with metallopeptidase domain